MWLPVFQGAVLAFNWLTAVCTIAANKSALKIFPYPATLTALHYAASTGLVVGLRLGGVFQRGSVASRHRQAWFALIAVWALCNSFSNASLEANSVGFYQLMKVLVTPIVVLLDRILYSKRLDYRKTTCLVLACLGVGIATVSDVQFNLRGALIALCSVLTGVAQKVLNEFMQQKAGLSTLQLMDLCFPAMTVIGICIAPLMDRPGVLSHLTALSPHDGGLVALSSLAAVTINYSTTLVLGVTNALALVLLGQMKTCSVLLVGYVVYDAPPNAAVLAGAALAVVSLAAFAGLKVCDILSRDALEKQQLLGHQQEMRTGAGR